MANRRKRRKLNVRGITALLLMLFAVGLAIFFALGQEDPLSETGEGTEPPKTEASQTEDVP